MNDQSSVSNPFDKLDWQSMVLPYARPDLRRSVWQIFNTLVPYFLLFGLMLWTTRISYGLTLVLALPAAGLLVRTFILFHDCCHGSFFKSRKANETLGSILGVLTFTPFYQWRRDHAIHHATAGNLDKRGVGDVKTMTVQEYLSAPWWKRLGYRIMRNPVFMFTIGASAVFLLLHRFWAPHAGRRERLNVIVTDLALLGLFLAGGLLFGFKAFIFVQLSIMILAASVGVWMFYIQHQFEGVYWERKDNWSFLRAGLQGSSYYRLPKVFQWFTGNIGFHHIHHLSPKIPNYSLPECLRDNPAFQIKPLTFGKSLKCARLNLWDEVEKRLISFSELGKYRQPAPEESY